ASPGHALRALHAAAIQGRRAAALVHHARLGIPTRERSPRPRLASLGLSTDPPLARPLVRTPARRQNRPPGDGEPRRCSRPRGGKTDLRGRAGTPGGPLDVTW